MNFLGQHILSVSQFDRQAIEQLIAVADLMKPYADRQCLTKVLDGAILGNMFFEPSTRTRLSFYAAMKQLGGQALGFATSALTSIKKGESNWR